jgi:hypothetical protein
MLVREGPRPALAKSNAGYAAALLALRQTWWARKIAPTLSYWIAATADCDSERDLKDGSTEARYRSCVSHKHTDTHQTVKAAILATFDGWLATRADGSYIIYSGRYYEPTVTIGPDEIVTYTWEGGGVDDDDAVNHLVCSYIAADSAYAVAECDPWRDEEDISRRGEELSDNQDAATPSWAQSRYLAKRVMARRNAANRGSVTTNIAGRAARGASSGCAWSRGTPPFMTAPPKSPPFHARWAAVSSLTGSRQIPMSTNGTRRPKRANPPLRVMFCLNLR